MSVDVFVDVWGKIRFGICERAVKFGWLVMIIFFGGGGVSILIVVYHT